MPNEDDDEYEIDNDSDMDGTYYGADVDITSRDSVTPESPRSERSDNPEDCFLDTNSTRSCSFSDTVTQIDARTSKSGDETIVNRTFEPRTPTADLDKIDSIRSRKSITCPTVIAGRLKMLSVDLDYALIEIEEPDVLSALKDLWRNESNVDSLRPTHVVTAGHEDTEIVTLTTSGRYLNGTLSGTPSFTRLPNSKTYQEIYMAQLNGPLAEGDCGSWILDAETGGLYGHIIAGCEQTGTAYIMPAHNVFEDAKKRLGSEIMLPGATLLEDKDASEKYVMTTISRCTNTKKRKQIESDAQPRERVPPVQPLDLPQSQSDLTNRNRVLEPWSSLKQKHQLSSTINVAVRERNSSPESHVYSVQEMPYDMVRATSPTPASPQDIPAGNHNAYRFSFAHGIAHQPTSPLRDVATGAAQGILEFHSTTEPLFPRSCMDQVVFGWEAATAMSPAKIVEVAAEDGTRQKRAQISRASRRQPKETSKVSCPICDDHKEGFHGDHELRRHIDRTHKGFRKVFICKDISPNGTFLAKCQRCRNRKTYGANYNAAAHLRRVHFNPCDMLKGGRGKVSLSRGGIGGGDQPPMDVLRNWMFETWETNTGLLRLDNPQDSNIACVPFSQSSSSGLDIAQLDETGEIQISDTDLDFVQQTTQLDMSFLR
jgi:hypothetical protein